MAKRDPDLINNLAVMTKNMVFINKGNFENQIGELAKIKLSLDSACAMQRYAREVNQVSAGRSCARFAISLSNPGGYFSPAEMPIGSNPRQ